jgi:F0F1-type ATP synthase membrane subunit c/vacuolar-type H+-ATPase subunit K
MEKGHAILAAIRQEALLSLTFGLAMLIAAVVIAIVLRNVVKQVARDMSAKSFGAAQQQRALRRFARAEVLFGFLMITAVFAFVHLFDAGTWLAANNPHASLVLRAGPVDMPPPGPAP